MAENKMRIRKTRSLLKIQIARIISLICVIGIIISGQQLVTWLFDTKNTEEQTGDIMETAQVAEIDSEGGETIENPEEPPSSPYWKYLNQSLIDVNLADLRLQNSDTKGWIKVSGTNINYPFVQSTNNDYYLTHSFDKSYNRAGWAFADFRNKIDGNDRNMIIYAHARTDGSMFGSLVNILSSEWVNNYENFTVRTVTDNMSALWQVFSVYKIPTTSDYIQTDFRSDDEYINWLNMLKGRSSYNFGATMAASDRIVTLSTCHGEDYRVVMHAKLIKYLPK